MQASEWEEIFRAQAEKENLTQAEVTSALAAMKRAAIALENVCATRRRDFASLPVCEQMRHLDPATHENARFYIETVSLLQQRLSFFLDGYVPPPH
jgi:hypothetical protein